MVSSGWLTTPTTASATLERVVVLNSALPPSMRVASDLEKSMKKLWDRPQSRNTEL